VREGLDYYEGFANVMGLEYNKNKTGSAYMVTEPAQKAETTTKILPKGDIAIGFLTLDENSGNWIIDQSRVDSHVEQLGKQLAACDSVLSWVQTWNGCIGRFFGNTFGEPAHCFGRQHLDSILRVHENMQRTLFQTTNSHGSTLTDHLKGLISSRFNVSNIPTAFLYMPEELGGLGLLNPFVPLLLVRDQLESDPEELFHKFYAQEKEAFSARKKVFQEMSEKDRRRRLKSIFPADERSSASSEETQKLLQPDTFITYEEFTRHRECTSLELQSLYIKLMTVPTELKARLTHKVSNALSTLYDRVPSRSAKVEWIIQVHSEELFETFGGLSIVDKGYLPLGVLAMMRQKKVTWTMVL
jgi:hypothetical protein